MKIVNPTEHVFKYGFFYLDKFGHKIIVDLSGGLG